MTIVRGKCGLAKKRGVFLGIKIIVYFFGLFILTVSVYRGINCLVYNNSIQNESVNETDSEQNDESQVNVGNKIAIIVGTATILMTVCTMLQQHINRMQDRALAFPKMVIKECQFVIGEDNVSRHTLLYNGKKGELLIKLLFQDTISQCYVPSIYRVAVAKHPYQRKVEKYSFLEILNCFSGFEESGFYIETTVQKSDLVEDFCKRQQGGYIDKLEIIMDVAWINDFYMLGFRNMWGMYKRCRIRLNDICRSYTDNDNGLYGYNVENFSLEEAPLWEKQG